MRTATLHRLETGVEGTFGTLQTDSGFTCATVELPWRENAPEISCIPQGGYYCVWDLSIRFGCCYHLRDVRGRSNILIHVGNWGGDVGMGFLSSVKGCISLGEAVGYLKGQKAVINSWDTIHAFEKDLAREAFTLTIR